VDQVVYRGYLIHLIAEADLWNTPGAKAGWSFHATPATPNLPILPQALFRRFNSRDEALARAKKEIDRLLD
jgi:hypothetical protein